MAKPCGLLVVHVWFLILTWCALADELPEPLHTFGNLPAPLDWVIPHYEDLPASYSWTGFLVSPLISYQTASFTGPGGHLIRGAQGVTLGAEAGYDHEIDQFVLGAATDASYSFMHASGNSLAPFGTKANIGLIGSVRAHAGYSVSRFQFYGTGGVAFGEVDVKDRFNLASTTQAGTGWTAGLGISYLWSESAIFRLEYRRLSLSDEDYHALPIGRIRAGVDMNIINSGFFYKF